MRTRRRRRRRWSEYDDEVQKIFSASYHRNSIRIYYILGGIFNSYTLFVFRGFYAAKQRQWNEIFFYLLYIPSADMLSAIAYSLRENNIPHVYIWLQGRSSELYMCYIIIGDKKDMVRDKNVEIQWYFNGFYISPYSVKLKIVFANYFLFFFLLEILYNGF